MSRIKIPLTWLDLAQQPVNSPCWKKSKDNEKEYMYFADNQWLVTNETVGPYRVRGIYKLIKEFKVE